MNVIINFDLFFVKSLIKTPAAAGFYGAAKNLTIVPALFAASFSPLLLAKLTLMSGQGQEDSARLMTRQAVRIVFCLLPFAGLAAGAAPEVVTAIYGRPFLPAASVLAILIFGAVGSTIISVTAVPLIAAGQTKLVFVLTSPLVVLAAGSHLIMIPRFGMVGAALGTTSLTWLGAAMILVAIHRIWKFLPPMSTLGRSILVCGVAYTAACKWTTPGLLLVLKLPAIGIMILLLFLLLGEFTAGDVTFVNSILPRRRVTE